MEILRVLGGGLVPALCAACGRSCRTEATLCSRCARRLAAADPLVGMGPPGLDRAWSSAPHEGVARELVAALKFRRLLPVADLIAERINWLAPASLLSGTIVPVPTTALRSLRRGFDPAAEIARALADLSRLPLTTCLRRSDRTRQLGRTRAERVGHPPLIAARAPVPRSVVLVDDVLTTGSTLSSCARALREGGAFRVVAVTFARRL